MIFTSTKRFGITQSSFLNSQHISYVFSDSIFTQHGRSPSDSNSIDYAKELCLIKLLEESNERKRLSFGLLSDKPCVAYDVINQSWANYPLRYFSYGYNERYGFVDTTGTASGSNAKRVLIKGIEELIEKNEMAFFWYLQKGSYIQKNKYICTLLRNYNFISNEIAIFQCNVISNLQVFFVLLFENKNFVASGSCASLDSEKALLGALNEALLLEWQNYHNACSLSAKLSKLEHQKVYNHYLQLKSQTITYLKKSYNVLTFET